jgi:hypothetical protein
VDTFQQNFACLQWIQFFDCLCIFFGTMLKIVCLRNKSNNNKRYKESHTEAENEKEKEQQNKTSDVVTTYITSHIIRHTTQAHETLDLQA